LAHGEIQEKEFFDVITMPFSPQFHRRSPMPGESFYLVGLFYFQ